MTQANTVAALLRRRLDETDRSPGELAEAANVPTRYVVELLDGTRRPPLPGRTDVYDTMTRFLKLGRNDLARLATAEREAAARAPTLPDAAVVRQLWALCGPQTRAALQRRRGAARDAELADLLQRLLEVTQGAVRRTLSEAVALRARASRNGEDYPAVRLNILEFLDATPDTLTVAQVEEFIRPHVTLWEIDPGTGALRVVMHS